MESIEKSKTKAGDRRKGHAASFSPHHLLHLSVIFCLWKPFLPPAHLYTNDLTSRLSLFERVHYLWQKPRSLPFPFSHLFSHLFIGFVFYSFVFICMMKSFSILLSAYTFIHYSLVLFLLFGFALPHTSYGAYSLFLCFHIWLQKPPLTKSSFVPICPQSFLVQTICCSTAVLLTMSSLLSFSIDCPILLWRCTGTSFDSPESSILT